MEQRPIRSAPEGNYVELVAVSPAHQALILGGLTMGAIGLCVPLDDLLDERLDTIRRLYRLLVQGRIPPADFTAYRRRRLKLALRALDATLAGADYRTIAEELFGDRVPKGSEFREASLRAQAIRLVRYGLRLMDGGYRDLLRPEQRAPRRTKTS